MKLNGFHPDTLVCSYVSFLVHLSCHLPSSSQTASLLLSGLSLFNIWIPYMKRNVIDIRVRLILPKMMIVSSIHFPVKDIISL